MSVKTLESYQEFTASGSATFTFNFNYVDSSEIVVGMRTGDNQYTVVDPVNYVLTQNASTDGGKIRFVTTKPCENPDDPTCGDYIDNPPPAGTIVRIERKTVQSSTADWYVGLDMKALVGLFDKLFRISQENSDKFKNTIQTFPTQQGITVRELLSEHDKKIFYWNNEKQWLDITDFTIDDVLKQTDVGDILEQANAYSDEQNALLENRINGKLTAVDAQIDANADAIQKTREDYINADSEIHQILNNHTSELTTLRGNQASLGDQVAGIEEKIPGDASATNQLATKADLKGAADGDFVKKSGDTMTGDLAFDVVAGGYTVAFQDSYENVGTGNTDSVIKRIQSNHSTQGLIFSETKNGTVTMQFTMLADGFVMPHGNRLLGNSDYPWENIYAKKLNNGADITVPTEGGTLARIEDLIDLRADINEADSELQTQITAQAAEIATKQDQLVAGDNIVISGNVISATGAGFDIVVVQELPATGQKGIIYLLAKDGAAPDVYDEYVWIETTQTFELIGSTKVDLTDYAKKEELDDYLPLSGGTVNGVVKIQNGQGTGSLWVGADVNNTTLTNNQRHLARIVVPSFTNIERGATLLGWDSSGDTNVHIANNSADTVGFGGSKKITNATSPMGISFCVAKTRESTAAADKVYPLAMDANAANFDVPVSAPDLTVGTAEGTINIGVVAGTATIATNNGLDIAAQTKFDTAPTTDDSTTYANALDTSLVRKAQVATAIADAVANVGALPDQTDNEGALLTTDGTNPQWTGFVGHVGDDTFGNKKYAIILDPGNKQTSDYKTPSPRTAINPQGDTASYGTNIGGTASAVSSVSIGEGSRATSSYTVAVGTNANASGNGSTVVGYGAKATNTYSIQLGQGTNDTENTFSVGLSTLNNYRLLEADGTIPAERIGNLDFGTMD